LAGAEWGVGEGLSTEAKENLEAALAEVQKRVQSGLIFEENFSMN